MMGKEIRELRLLLGMTQTQFAEAVGVARYTISKWELDKAKPRALHAQRLQLISARERAD